MKKNKTLYKVNIDKKLEEKFKNIINEVKLFTLKLNNIYLKNKYKLE